MGNKQEVLELLIRAIKEGKGLEELNADLEKTQAKTKDASENTKVFDFDLQSLANTVLGSVSSYLSLAGAVSLFVTIAKEALEAAAESQMVMVKLDGTLASTGRSAEISAAQISRTAAALSDMSAFDDEAILSAYTSIAKFSNIDNAGMEKIVKTAMDVTAVMGGDLAGNAENIARILETGVVPRSLAFNEALKAQVTELIAAGDSSAALDVVLGELNKRYGGQAVAQLDTYTGSLERLKNEGSDLMENIGGGELAPGTQLNMWFTDLFASFNLMFDMAGKANRTAEDVRWEQYGLNWETAIGKAAAATAAATADLADYSGVYKDVNSYAQQYEQSARSIAKAEKELADLQAAGWGEHSAKIMDAKAKIEELQAAQERQTNSWILGILQQQLSMDGLSKKEFDFLLQYQVDTGLLSEEAAQRARDVYNEAQNIAASINSIPSQYSVDIWINQHGVIPAGVPGKVVTQSGLIQDAPSKPGLASGGPVSAGELYKVNEFRSEYFRPDMNGEIVPLGGGGGGGPSVNVVLNYSPGVSFSDEHELRDLLENTVRDIIRDARREA